MIFLERTRKGHRQSDQHWECIKDNSEESSKEGGAHMGFLYSVQFSPFSNWVVGGTWETIQQRSSSGLFCRRPLWAALAWAGMSTLFDVVYPAFPLPTTMSPTLQVTLKDGFGEAVLACDMPELCKFLSLDSCQKRLLVLLTQRNFLYLWHLFNWTEQRVSCHRNKQTRKTHLSCYFLHYFSTVLVTFCHSQTLTLSPSSSQFLFQTFNFVSVSSVLFVWWCSSW